MAGKSYATRKWFRKNNIKTASDEPNEEAGGDHVSTKGSLQVKVKESQPT